MVKVIPTKKHIDKAWNKYGLIVVGNIVFFVLLYFISYRPNNDENRAAEFLAMAQSAQNRGRAEAAIELYQKVLADYPDTRAGKTARDQLPALKTDLAEGGGAPVPQPAEACDELDLEEMLRKGPSVYIATFLAEHYTRFPADRAKIKEAIWHYLGVAVNYEGIELGRLRHESEFQDPAFQREFFDIRPVCEMEQDWIYDDFSVRNGNFYSWTNVNLQAVVQQDGEQETRTLRLPRLAPGQSVELMEFRVRGGGGAVTCSGELTSREGKISFSTQL